DLQNIFSAIYNKPESPIWQIITAEDATKLGADPRPVLFLDAAPSYVMTDRASGAAVSEAADRAASGYLPSREPMFGVFIACGKGITTGAHIEYGRLIDVAPTAARLLGLEMQTAKGRVYTEVISQ
ncbi:MAG: hypothetical protein J2P31_17110, partial [Blastocatellia bacterium]|nr:hypothetical protein [Blastocatellia bacterium]